MVVQTTSNNKKIRSFKGGRYASTEQELYMKAIQLLDKYKVEHRR